MMHFDFETYLPEDILTKVDRMSMAHSIESRVPLLDNQVVDFAAATSRESENQERSQETHPQGSGLDAAAGADPGSPKQGFAVPVGGWFRGDLREFFSDVLRLAARGNAATSTSDLSIGLVREHVGGRRDHTLRLWALVVFELWHRQYLDASAIRRLGPGRAPCPPRPEVR